MEEELPFVLLPEVAGEGDEQHRGEGSQPGTEPNPELHTFTRQRPLIGQGHTSHAQLGFGPHRQQILRIHTHMYGAK